MKPNVEKDPILKTPIDQPTVDEEAFEKLQEVQDLRKTPRNGSPDGPRRLETSKLMAMMGKGAAFRKKLRKSGSAVEPASQPVEDSTTSYANYLLRNRVWYQRPEVLIWASLGGVLAIGIATLCVIWLVAK